VLPALVQTSASSAQWFWYRHPTPPPGIDGEG